MKKILALPALLFSAILFSQNPNLKGSCVSGNCKNGFGKFVYENGVFYEGKFKKGRFEGIGTEIYADGTKINGEFKDGQQIGQAKVIRADGNIWEGKSIYGNPYGFGKMIYLNGIQYTGIMNRWCEKEGEGIYTLKNGYSIKGTFKGNKPDVVAYFDAENNTISKEIFESQEKIEIAGANENYSQQLESKLQQYILKNRGVVVQNITIPITNATDLSDMSFRTSEIDILFSSSKDNLLCIMRKARKPSNYDFNNDPITAFSVNSQKKIYSGSFENFEQTEVGKKISVKYFVKPEVNEFILNYSDETVKQIITDLNILTAPAGNIEFEIANENHMIFKDLHRQDNSNKKTFYFINKKTNSCEKIVTLNGKYIDMVWNEDFTKSCFRLNSKLPENLVPDAYKYHHYSSLYIIDWETFQMKFIDDHANQLNYLAIATTKSNQSASDYGYQQNNEKVEAINKQNIKTACICSKCNGSGTFRVKTVEVYYPNVVNSNGQVVGKSSYSKTIDKYEDLTCGKCLGTGKCN